MSPRSQAMVLIRGVAKFVTILVEIMYRSRVMIVFGLSLISILIIAHTLPWTTVKSTVLSQPAVQLDVLQIMGHVVSRL